MLSRERVKELLRPYYLRWLYFPLFPRRRPPYFPAAWNYICRALGDDILAMLPEGPGQPDVLFLPMTDWHTRIQRSQQLSMALAGLGHRCLYLNPHLGREFPRPYRFSQRAALCRLEERIGELHVHLPREPVFHRRRLSQDEARRILATLKLAIRDLGIRNLVQVVSFPLWLEVARDLREELGFPIVYDCHDLLSGFGNIAPELIHDEDELLRLCDLALFSSDRLLRDKQGLVRHSLLLRNAVNPQHFAGCERPVLDGPVIGYVGALDRWFDVAAVQRSAEEHPDWHFMLIGRVEEPRIYSLRRLSNVELRGEVPYAQLAAHVNAFTVGIIPFLKTDLTAATNPIKLYEYFSLGIPVVSTDLPEVARYSDLVYVAQTETFSARLEQAVAEQDPAVRRRRLAIAQQESWQARANTLLARLEKIRQRPALS